VSGEDFGGGQPGGSDAQRVKLGLEGLSQPGVAPLTPSLLADIKSRAIRKKRRKAVAVAGGFSLAAGVIVAVVIVGALNARPNRDPDYIGADSPIKNESAGEAPDGFHWEAVGGALIAIPDSWETGSAPGPDWCRQPALSQRPYIDLEYTGDPAAQPCDVEFPDETQVMHVTVNPAEQPAPWSPQSAVWSERSVIVGDLRVTVTFDAAHAELADQILKAAEGP
jgi:hypothetical protein